MEKTIIHILTGSVGAVLLSGAVRALPEPQKMGNPFYLWFYKFTHYVLANYDKARAVVVLLCVLLLTSAAHAQCAPHDLAWIHVYNPERLAVQSPCVSVTGTVADATANKRKDGLRHEEDGDCHGWLKLDPGQTQYLNAGNRSHEGGNLVFEAPCLYVVHQADAMKACKDWANTIKIPPVGSHVRITGSWVKDDNHAQWFEIHPVWLIEVLK